MAEQIPYVDQIDTRIHKFHGGSMPEMGSSPFQALCRVRENGE